MDKGEDLLSFFPTVMKLRKKMLNRGIEHARVLSEEPQF